MDRKTIVDMLVLLNSHDPADCEGDLSTLCDINVRSICNRCRIDVEGLTTLNKNLNRFNPNDVSIIWKYVCLNFHFFDRLRNDLDSTPSEDVLSVQQTKFLKSVLRNVAAIGIRCNLQPNMPGYRQLPTEYVEETEPILTSYNRLTASVFALISYLRCAKLRGVILADNFRPILSALYQIVYCPLKKPEVNGSGSGNMFAMTSELYARFVEEKELFRKELEYLEKSLLKVLYVKETMLLPEGDSPPIWLVKAIARNLNKIIVDSTKGIETITYAMLDSSADYDPNDSAKNWKILDVLSKLILNLSDKPEFESISRQLVDLFQARDRSAPLDDLYVVCVKKLYISNEDLCKKTLLPPILNQLRIFADKNRNFLDGEKVTDLILRINRTLNACFLGKIGDNLPIELLTPHIAIISELFPIIEKELSEILIQYLKRQDKERFFDLFLFGIVPEGIATFRDDFYLEHKGGDLIVKSCDFKHHLSLTIKGQSLMNLCKNEKDLALNLFIYLLDVLIRHEKYLKASGTKDLLEIEDEFVLDEILQRKLIVYRLLSELAEDPIVQTNIRDNPREIIRFLRDFLQKTLDSGIHKMSDYDSGDFQIVFTLIMILQALIVNAERRDHFKELVDILQSLFWESTNVELRNLLKSILDVLKGDGRGHLKEAKSELEKALDDVCDPILPVRGHGLMTLSKLMEDKNPDALDRKNYILNIFQQNLKDSDSFIYLSSINGLVAMGNLFPDVVLNILTDEYSDFTRREAEDSLETRMKLGEILVKVTKTLGETAPKYKSLLLNTFLIGTKDEDYLIRASSLSNLGEICRVLSYKLGSIVIEVLVCVHAIITTDKAVEARRAAVTVIRQLLAGLEVETVTFLKDHILEIYRTLKMIYTTDKDDVMRLQAQLALEELNENVKKFLLAGPQLPTSKEFVLPKIN